MLNRKKIIMIIILILAGLSSAKAYYDTNTIEVKKFQIRHSSLGEVLAGRKVAHLSDLHINHLTDLEKKIIEILDQEKPDIIFLTGDYIKNSGSFKPVLSFFSQLKAPLGIYAVMGNSDYYNENGSCILCHKENSKRLKENPPLIFLRNSHVEIKINGRYLTVLGVDDPVGKRNDLMQSFIGVPENRPSILLAHSPEIFPEASLSGLDLVLSGHTHGGQLWVTKYLNKVFPLETALTFSEGFFQKGRSLLYVNRGIGTSFLPFRFGEKPEITFYNFANPSGQAALKNPIQISTASSNIVFAGLNLSSFPKTFNLFDFDENKRTRANVPGKPTVLFDFESSLDLKRLNWECHKWFELSELHATSGKYSLKASLPPGRYPGINFKGLPPDWSHYAHLEMDVFNPTNESIQFHLRMDDHKSEWEYANRFDAEIALKPGANSISVPFSSLKTNLHHRALDLKKIERLIVFVPDNQKTRVLYIDNIRLI